MLAAGQPSTPTVGLGPSDWFVGLVSVTASLPAEKNTEARNDSLAKTACLNLLLHREEEKEEGIAAYFCQGTEVI